MASSNGLPEKAALPQKPREGQNKGRPGFVRARRCWVKCSMVTLGPEQGWEQHGGLSGALSWSQESGVALNCLGKQGIKNHPSPLLDALGISQLSSPCVSCGGTGSSREGCSQDLSKDGSCLKHLRAQSASVGLLEAPV